MVVDEELDVDVVVVVVTTTPPLAAGNEIPRNRMVAPEVSCMVVAVVCPVTTFKSAPPVLVASAYDPSG